MFLLHLILPFYPKLHKILMSRVMNHAEKGINYILNIFGLENIFENVSIWCRINGCVLMAELEEEILQKAELEPYLWWRYIDDIFFLWEHGEEVISTNYYLILIFVIITITNTVIITIIVFITVVVNTTINYCCFIFLIFMFVCLFIYLFILSIYLFIY